jgi:erythromycin esterase-like protein
MQARRLPDDTGPIHRLSKRRMDSTLRHRMLDGVRDAAQPLSGTPGDYDELLALVGDAQFVLIGEASHGTHEFYRERAVITQRLIVEKGFDAVCIEGDWPDAVRVHRYLQGTSDDPSADAALSGFQRFPAWMWRNTDVLDFVGWLREHNDSQAEAVTKCGFFGLDLYSLHASIEAVLRYLDQVDPQAAQRARGRYSCFDHFGDDTQVYGLMTGLGTTPSCETEVIRQLVELQRRPPTGAARGDDVDEPFFAEQNARLVKNAEQYYRTMYLSNVSSWNLRDRHMAETLDALAVQLRRRRGRAKLVVWAHNSHLGDARATEMGERRGELNLGQLVREQHGRDAAVLIGFTTHHGSVTAATDWGGPAECKSVRPALPGSVELLFYDSGLGRFLLPLRSAPQAARELREPQLERAIGVIYRPETERQSHYFQARLSEQFDAVLHFDETSAVLPLERFAPAEPPALSGVQPTED